MRRRHWTLLAALALALAACGTDGGGDTTEAAGAAATTAADTAADTTAATAAETTTADTMAETTTAETMADTTTGGSGSDPYDYGSGSTGGEATGAGMLMVADSSEGQILVDHEGYSLYLFVPDGQGESTCYDECEANWPPVEGDVEAGDGVDASLIGTTERTDGSTQATYDGWPLYYFANDLAPGDVNGQGVNDVWFLLSPEGEGIGMP